MMIWKMFPEFRILNLQLISLQGRTLICKNNNEAEGYRGEADRPIDDLVTEFLKLAVDESVFPISLSLLTCVST